MKKIRSIVLGISMSVAMSVTAIAGTTTTGSAGGCTYNGKITYNANYNGWSSVRTYGSYGTAYVYVKNTTTFVQTGGANSIVRSQYADSPTTRDVTVSFNAPDSSYYPLVISGQHKGVANGETWTGSTSYSGPVK